MLQRLITELERVTKQLSEIDKVVAQQALDDPRALKLMTIPGVSSVVASSVLAPSTTSHASSHRISSAATSV
ncbi:hypothetical protein [Bradyrhizobium sp. STM 3566]|uniref:hypothetical protein n=1 Tax=Bradyrhizobium sp. STM 3566 TaxID=578928 RepID=UPI0038909994